MDFRRSFLSPCDKGTEKGLYLSPDPPSPVWPMREVYDSIFFRASLGIIYELFSHVGFIRFRERISGLNLFLDLNIVLSRVKYG